MTEFLELYGFAAVLLLMFTNGLASAPPSESTLAVGGYMVALRIAPAEHIFLAALIGNLLGATCLYLIGVFVSQSRLNRFLCLVSKSLPVLRNTRFATVSDVAMQHLYIENRFLMLCFLRCAPVVRSIISLPAGAYRVPFLTFILLSALGCAVWIITWMCIGYMSYEFYSQSAALKLMIFGVGILVAYIALKRAVTQKLNYLTVGR